MDQAATPLSLLYPFKHQFYRRLGWGLVGTTRLYRPAPEALPLYPERLRVRPVLTAEQREAVMACYRRRAAAANGMLERGDAVWFERVFKNAICYAFTAADERVEGYLTYAYQPRPADEAFVSTDLQVFDFVFETAEAMRGLLGFLAAQQGQVRIVKLPLQDAPPLEYALSEPRMADGIHNWQMGAESSWTGAGLMGRVVNVRRALAAGGFGPGAARVALKISDPLIPANEETVTVAFQNGRAEFIRDAAGAAEFVTDIATFSSIYWGALRLDEAARMGLCTVNGDAAATAALTAIFAVSKPVCLDWF